MEYNLPKKRLSYTQVSMWKSNRDQYRKRYYMNQDTFETVEMRFGKRIAKMLEANDPLVAFVPRYSTSEHGINVDIQGILVQGYIDSFDAKKKAFREYKTGHMNTKNQAPWNDVLVHKHDQLPFYSLLIEESEGSVDPVCYLDWIETEFKKKTREFQGMTLISESRDLILTGKIKTFKRRIEKWERDRIREMILNTAREVSEDYTNWLKNNV